MKLIKYLCVICVSIYSSFLLAADDCNNGTTPTGYAYYMTNGQVNSIGVRESILVTSISNDTCSHKFYIQQTKQEMLSILLASKASGKTVKAYFLSDANSPDQNWGGEFYTHNLVALDQE